MKKKYTLIFPDHSVYAFIAIYVVYGLKIAVLSFLALGVIYTLGGGK